MFKFPISVVLGVVVCCGVLAMQSVSGQAAQEATVQATNDRFAASVLQSIAGRENEPAEKVFRNLQVGTLKGVPAGRFVRIMNAGYSRALGVTCTHCHNTDDFAADVKRPKRAAREMAAMHTAINGQLAKMQNLESSADQRFINCSTCHRGAIKPN
jgi:hypothetical protein